MNALDKKINDSFPGIVVRKDLVKAVKGNAVVPTYVLEYLLGQYCATNDEATIDAALRMSRRLSAFTMSTGMKRNWPNPVSRKEAIGRSSTKSGWT